MDLARQVPQDMTMWEKTSSPVPLCVMPVSWQRKQLEGFLKVIPVSRLLPMIKPKECSPTCPLPSQTALGAALSLS